ncbi:MULTISPECIES: GntR family transcriptional regulator [Nocardia]|uniref:GntR family transcriptional regulator n=1 Tax=Nocardia implantans TaxID=3108168 RepID=A0ABU6AP08_9NOCA|nr:MULTISPECIES: GntR family transcriptional regulator [unclassified Nocardia]MBF6192348.1 GntR family transcriptional regulator [Nocardia beijingensis]MEA3531101.1 GntR family transcriptional regulator [Nocardia sp. CDC192]MEB3509191.1 GntR family transcriptional regulator [Nocardia sp. CDC186]
MSTRIATLADAAGKPLRDVVYEKLRGELMNGDIKFGERLTEPKLSTRFGISRTPIREALTVLCSDGLLQREEYGFSPVRPSIPLIRDLYELRITLELGGLQRAMTNPAVTHDRALLEAERAAWLELRADPPEQEPGFVVRDEEFHVTLLTAAGNTEMVRALKAVNSRIRHVRMYDFMVNNRIETTIAEHLGILEAVLAEDLSLAYRLLHTHIGESLDVVLERVTRAIAAMSLATE